MARQNLAMIYGRVAKAPVISKNMDTGEYNYGMVYVDVVRGPRAVGDDLHFIKHDHPLLMSSEKDILDDMIGWKVNDIVLVKGVVTSKKVPKSSSCPYCKDENGNATRNSASGQLLYITPIFAEKLRSYGEGDDKKIAAIEDVVDHSEISNQVLMVGTLLKDPKIFTTKEKKQITQYPIATNRKFTIRTDDPSIKTDWPMVKSYGEQARDDKLFLSVGSEVLIDGFLQARTLKRTVKCACCEQFYKFKDHSMEIVPFAVEYLANYKTKEDVEAERKQTIEELRQSLFTNNKLDNELDEEMKTEDIIKDDEDSSEIVAS